MSDALEFTHLAARMEQMALPGSIAITADTLRLAEGYVVVKPLGPMSVKGLSEPIEVYEVTGASTVRSRFQAAAARGLTRFVGRDGELLQLGQALEAARAGHGQVVAVVGEPGVGKSRLYWEFYRRTAKRQEAQEHLTTATTMYREMDMRFWLEKVEAEMAALR